jgi:hypothetical protein
MRDMSDMTDLTQVRVALGQLSNRQLSNRQRRALRSEALQKIICIAREVTVTLTVYSQLVNSNTPLVNVIISKAVSVCYCW